MGLLFTELSARGGMAGDGAAGRAFAPLLVLRSLQLTARAVDDHLVGSIGFGLGDVIELAVRYTDRRITGEGPYSVGI
jgi:hypothetical protein